MPWHIRHGSGPRPYKVVKNATGKTVGTSKTLAKAEAMIRAMFAAEGKKRG